MQEIVVDLAKLRDFDRVLCENRVYAWKIRKRWRD